MSHRRMFIQTVSRIDAVPFQLPWLSSFCKLLLTPSEKRTADSSPRSMDQAVSNLCCCGKEKVCMIASIT